MVYGVGTSNTEPPNWLQSCTDRSKKRAKTTLMSFKKKAAHSWENEDPAAKDGICFDKLHQTYEIRQYGKDPIPLSGQNFYNQRTGMVEVYDDISKAPVSSF